MGSVLNTCIDINDRLWDEDTISERLSCKNPLGLTLAQLVEWAQCLCDEHGSDALLSDLSLDKEFPSIELERPLLKVAE